MKQRSKNLESPELFEKLLTYCILFKCHICMGFFLLINALSMNLFFTRKLVFSCVACAAITDLNGFTCWFS